MPSAKLVGKEKYSIISNYLGTPEAAYDATGKKVWSCELDIYGKIKHLEGDAHFVPFRYQGQYHDTEIDLYYNRFRYYSPESGMYVSQDPIRLNGGYAFYSYTKNVNFLIDPFGLSKVEHFSDFDGARTRAFEIASGGDPNVTFEPTKIDPKTGTEVEFKGSNGSKIAYDSAHADMDILQGHDKPHVGVQTGGKRGGGGASRYNLTFDGPTHPHRSPIKGEGCL